MFLPSGWVRKRPSGRASIRAQRRGHPRDEGPWAWSGGGQLEMAPEVEPGDLADLLAVALGDDEAVGVI